MNKYDEIVLAFDFFWIAGLYIVDVKLFAPALLGVGLSHALKALSKHYRKED